MRIVLAGLATLALACNQHEVSGGSAFGDAEGGDGSMPTSAAHDGDGWDDGGAGGSETADAAADDPAPTDADGPTAGTDGGPNGDADSDPSSGSGSDSGTAPDTGSDSDGGSTETGGAESGDGSDTGPDDRDPVGTDACGFPLDGPWLEIEYTQAGASATSPSWTYSDTPGWGEGEWAAQGESWPEVWDVYGNIGVANDPIGVVATVGPSGSWQLMLGFQDLVAYDSATVCVEGRSVSASASVMFEAYNPLTGLGGSAMMAHDWQVHAEGIELGSPFNPGGGVQAVRIVTTGGSGALGIKRMRLIVHGAVY